MNLKFHTSSSSIARVTIWPGRRMKYSRRVNSRGSRSTGFAVAPHGPLDEIHFQSPDLQSRLPRVAAPPQERVDPRRQFADVEGLDQIVVAAGFQSD